MIKLVCVWIIMLPVFLISTLLAVTQILDRNGFPSFIFFWIGAALALFAATVLFRVSRDFLNAES